MQTYFLFTRHDSRPRREDPRLTRRLKRLLDKLDRQYLSEGSYHQFILPLTCASPLSQTDPLLQQFNDCHDSVKPPPAVCLLPFAHANEKWKQGHPRGTFNSISFQVDFSNEKNHTFQFVFDGQHLDLFFSKFPVEVFNKVFFHSLPVANKEKDRPEMLIAAVDSKRLLDCKTKADVVSSLKEVTTFFSLKTKELASAEKKSKNLWSLNTKGVSRGGQLLIPRRIKPGLNIDISSLFIGDKYACACFDKSESSSSVFRLYLRSPRKLLINYGFDLKASYMNNYRFVFLCIHKLPYGDLVVCCSAENFFFWLISQGRASKVAVVPFVKMRTDCDYHVVHLPSLYLLGGCLVINRGEYGANYDNGF